MNCRTWTIVIASAVVVSAAPSAARAGKWEAIEQIAGRAPVAVQVGDKTRMYFRVLPAQPLVVPIDGPARVKLVSRAEPPRGAALATYHLAVTERGQTVDETHTEAGVSDQVTAGGRPVCKGRKLSFDVPAGRHNLRITVAGVPSALVRLRVAAPQAGEDMITLTPIDAARSVVVSEGEKLIPYYSALPGKPVTLRIVGPTTVDLLTRLDFDATMRGAQRYKLALSMNGKPLRTAGFSTTKATTASYTTLRDRVPSKFDRLQVEIPEGTHLLTIALADPARGAAEIHARIPKLTAGNEE